MPKTSVKKWYRSKMLWTNMICMIGIIIHVCVSEEVSKQWLAAEASILAIINMFLRMTTNQGLQK